ncbi:hypothetical protein SFC43_26945 [Bacteroides sp. CR5/BHMF/2]|nr:hypothetical protein [Bacteroides sp. CR5/BHMF/2]
MQDGSLYLEMPTINEKQTFHDKGTTWDYYIKNGLTLLVSASANRDYGKYYTLSIVLTNNSNQPIDFNPSLITAYNNKKNKMETLKVLEANEYIERVSRRQNWGAFLMHSMRIWQQQKQDIQLLQHKPTRLMRVVLYLVL